MIYKAPVSEWTESGRISNHFLHLLANERMKERMNKPTNWWMIKWVN